MASQVLTLDDLLALLARLGWILYLVYVVLFFLSVLRAQGPVVALIRLLSARVLLPILLPISATLLSLSVVFVLTQEVTVIVSTLSPNGVRPQPLTGGLHLIVPVLETEVSYPISWQTYTMSARPSEGAKAGDDAIRARTSDGQEVRLDTSIIFRIDPAQVVRLHRDWQSRYIEDLVRPVVRGVVRTQVSQFTVQEVNSSARADLETTLGRLLTEQLGEKGLIVEQFLLRDVAFTPEYAAAIERKQVALEGQEQALHEAEQVRNRAAGEGDRLRIEAEGRAQAILQEAEAQAEALRMLAVPLEDNASLLTYRYIERLAPNLRVMLVPNNAPLLLPLTGLAETDTTNLWNLEGSTTLTTTTPATHTESAQALPLLATPMPASAAPAAAPTTPSPSPVAPR